MLKWFLKYAEYFSHCARKFGAYFYYCLLGNKIGRLCQKVKSIAFILFSTGLGPYLIHPPHFTLPSTQHPLYGSL